MIKHFELLYRDCEKEFCQEDLERLRKLEGFTKKQAYMIPCIENQVPSWKIVIKVKSRRFDQNDWEESPKLICILEECKWMPKKAYDLTRTHTYIPRYYNCCYKHIDK